MRTLETGRTSIDTWYLALILRRPALRQAINGPL